jgi:WD40 repeat protein
MARVFETVTGKEIAGFRHTGTVAAVAFGANGDEIASGDWDGWTEVRSLRGTLVKIHLDADVHSVALSADGRLVAIGANEVADVIDLATRKKIMSLPHEDVVRSIRFSDDGAFLTTTSSDRTRIFDIHGGRELARVQDPDVVAVRASRSSSGSYLDLVESTGGIFRVRREPLRTEDLVDETCRRLTRNLTLWEWRKYLAPEPYAKTCSMLPLPRNAGSSL